MLDYIDENKRPDVAVALRLLRASDLEHSRSLYVQGLHLLGRTLGPEASWLERARRACLQDGGHLLGLDPERLAAALRGLLSSALLETPNATDAAHLCEMGARTLAMLAEVIRNPRAEAPVVDLALRPAANPEQVRGWGWR